MRVVRLVTWLVLLVTTCSTQAEEDVDDYTDDINGSTIWTIYVTNIQSAISDLINEGKVTPHSCLENEEAGYVKDEDKEYVVQSMDDLNLDYNITQTEVVTQMKEERATCSPLFCPTPFMYSFMTQLQISYFLNAVVSSSPRVTVKTIGTTIYGRNIQLVHLAPCKSDNPSNPQVNPNPSKPKAIWIQAGLAGNEWITTSVALHLMKNLLGDCEASRGFHFYFLFVANPDGLFFSRSEFSPWPKNLHSFGNACRGVCVVFNFPSYFGYGNDYGMCHPFYRGPGASSEIETRAIIEAMDAITERQELVMVIDLKQAHNTIALPYGWAEEKPPDFDDMYDVALTFSNAIWDKYRIRYSVSNQFMIMGGTVIDYAKGSLGVKYPFMIFMGIAPELYFHPSPISLSVRSVWDGFSAMLTKIRAERAQQAREALLAANEEQESEA